MIIEYNQKYDNEVKRLLVQLQEYIVGIDQEKYNIVTPLYGEKYLKQTLEEIEKCHGKMYLYQEDEQLYGLVVAVIDNDPITTYDFIAPKRGRITELIVDQNIRGKGIGQKLLAKAEDYLYNLDCEAILIGVFAYNDQAINFYSKNNYHNRLVDMIKAK
ncbi:MAG TPA: GNAT family N-acetyltransferase [Bacilli bacterium]|nr:GNAT family N-acetyltransferase [Bacilli bacterium]